MRDFQGSEKEAYLQGRLLGLNELIKVLRESIDSNESNHGVIQSIVGHISGEMDGILDDLEGVHREHPVVEQAREKHDDLKASVKEIQAVKEPRKEEKEEKELARSSLFKENVDTADDLMKGLLKVQK